MTERSGVEIDYCPKCRGVWLDRGELDKIIERSSYENKGKPIGNYYESKNYPYEKDYKYKRRKGFLDDLFDF